MSGKKRFLGIAALAAWAVLALSCSGGGGGGGTGTGGLAIFWSPGANPLGNELGDVFLRKSGASTPGNLVLEVVVYGDLIKVYGIAFQLDYDPDILQFQPASEGSVLNADGCNLGNCTLFIVKDCATVLNSCPGCEVPNSCPFIVVGLTRQIPACFDCADGPDVDCTNGIDDDGDTVIDETDCFNDIDDDGDGLMDEDETGGIDFVAGANVVMTLRFTAAAAGGPPPSNNLFFIEPHAESVVNDWTPTDLSNDWIGGTVSVM